MRVNHTFSTGQTGFTARASSITNLAALSMHASTRIKPVTRNGVRVPVSAVCMPALPLQQPYILWPVRKPAGAATRHQPASVRPAAMHPHGTDSAIASGSSSTSPHPFPVAQPPSCPPAFPQSLSSPTTSGRVGVVIVDHGSRKSDSNAMLHEVGRQGVGTACITGRPCV